MRLVLFLTLSLTLALAGCDRASKAAENSAPPPRLLIAPEDVVTVRPLAVSSGPLITGTIQPDRKADLRAEISAVVLAVLKENGQPVKKGDLLVRLDDTAIRDSVISAQEAQRTAGQAFEQAERQFQRLSTLRASGMVSAQQMEDAEIRRNTTQSDLSAARARMVQARQQLQRTEARAPFDGLVSDRKVSAGDTVQVGKELVKVIDPAHLRFEGLVSSDALSSVKPGQAVNFRVNGWGAQEFNGRIRLVAPAANPTTRQVEVLVDIEGAVPARMAGLYAEGRIEAASSVALMIPSSSVVRDGERAFAWKVQGAALRKVALSLGERDVRRGDYAVQSGVADGDQLLRHPVATLKDGQSVSNTVPAGGSAASASAAASAPIVR
ncbi:efflux RND transporter periplasmic adaptor subunit [Caenimonas sp. SL110]|uniref:efflux RND transporter periplasmic adaptor subunit n=1 Tax=Caenimonas sp. SL110 TaxID=1450524 RepID=UPI000AFE10D5|nr:efflux RND transporter periplasmic adaptor subunit [Caenimonas sp. SL110]